MSGRRGESGEGEGEGEGRERSKTVHIYIHAFIRMDERVGTNK